MYKAWIQSNRQAKPTIGCLLDRRFIVRSALYEYGAVRYLWRATWGKAVHPSLWNLMSYILLRARGGIHSRLMAHIGPRIPIGALPHTSHKANRPPTEFGRVFSKNSLLNCGCKPCLGSYGAATTHSPVRASAAAHQRHPLQHFLVAVAFGLFRHVTTLVFGTH